MSRPSRSVRALILPIALAALGPSFVACGGSDDEATNGTVPVDDGAGASSGKGDAGASGAATGKGGSGGAGAGGATGKGGSSASGSGGGSSAGGSGGSSSGGAAGAGKGGTSAGGSSAGGSGGAASGGAGGAGKGGTSSGGSGGAGKGGTSSGGSGGAGKSGAAGAAAGSAGSDANAVWYKASLTNFESYPDPGSEECVKYNGCTWAGQFAAVDGKQTEAWVMAHNIAAVHSKDFDKYKLKTLRLRKDGHEIDVVVYDECADSDCSGCCTQNAKPSGNLIDLEKYTAERFGVPADGQVEWRCLDCN